MSRKYYVITQTNDYDGYDAYTCFIGDNPLETYNRVKYLLATIKNDFFEDYEEEEIYGDRPSKEKFLDWANRDLINAFAEDRLYFNMNDDCEKWFSIYVTKLHKNEYSSRRIEDNYNRAKERGEL